MLGSIEGTPAVECWFPDLRTCTTCGSRPLASSVSRGKARGAARRFLLLFPPPHPPDDFIHRSGSASKRNVFRAGAVWHLAMSPLPRLFPLVMRSCVLAGLAEWHGHTICEPFRERIPSKYLKRHDVLAVFEARPTRQSVRFLFRRCSRGTRFRFVLLLRAGQVRPYVFRLSPIIRQGRHPAAVRLSV